MTYNSAYRTAVQLTAEARAAADIAATGYQLARFMPDRENPGLNYSFDLNAVNLPDAASFRAFDAEAPYGSVPGGQSRSGALPPMSRKLRVSEATQLQLQQQADDLLGTRFENYARRLGAGFAARLELARGQAMETGTVVIDENRLKFVVDFGRKASHTTTAGVLWSDFDAPALTHELTWLAAYTASNSAGWGVQLISTATMLLLQQNREVIAASVGRGTDLPNMISRDAVQAVFSTYGLGRIQVFDEQVQVAGQPVRVLSANKVVFAPDPATAVSIDDGGVLGGTDIGVPAEALNPDYGISAGEAPGIFAAAFHEPDPEGFDILGSTIALPVLEAANATFAATVS